MTHDPIEHRLVPLRGFDELKMGEVFALPSRTINDANFAAFQTVSLDNHPIHYDVEYARARGLRGPAAHGLLLTAMTALGAAPVSHRLTESMIAMLGTTTRFRKLATVGDTITTRFVVNAVEPKGDERGLLRLGIVMTNQDGDVVLDGEHQIMLKRRKAPRHG